MCSSVHGTQLDDNLESKVEVVYYTLLIKIWIFNA